MTVSCNLNRSDLPSDCVIPTADHVTYGSCTFLDKTTSGWVTTYRYSCPKNGGTTGDTKGVRCNFSGSQTYCPWDSCQLMNYSIPARTCSITSVSKTSVTQGAVDSITFNWFADAHDTTGRTAEFYLVTTNGQQLNPVPANCSTLSAAVPYTYKCLPTCDTSTMSCATAYTLNTQNLPAGSYYGFCHLPTPTDKCSGNVFCEYENPAPTPAYKYPAGTCGAGGYVSCSPTDNVYFQVVAPTPTLTVAPTATRTPTPTLIPTAMPAPFFVTASPNM